MLGTVVFSSFFLVYLYLFCYAPHEALDEFCGVFPPFPFAFA
jgi:hypothetical protein